MFSFGNRYCNKDKERAGTFSASLQYLIRISKDKAIFWLLFKVLSPLSIVETQKY